MDSDIKFTQWTTETLLDIAADAIQMLRQASETVGAAESLTGWRCNGGAHGARNFFSISVQAPTKVRLSYSSGCPGRAAANNSVPLLVFRAH
jgi:hypothetical protein